MPLCHHSSTEYFPLKSGRITLCDSLIRHKKMTAFLCFPKRIERLTSRQLSTGFLWLRLLLGFDTTAESFEAFCRKHDGSRLYLKSAVKSSNMKGDRTVPYGAAKLLTSCWSTVTQLQRSELGRQVLLFVTQPMG